MVVPVHNGGDQLLDCLRSLNQLVGPPPAILLVDNASTDGAIEKARLICPKSEVLVQPVNLGFAAACNLGLNLARERDGRIALILNQDTVVAPDMVEKLLQSMLDKPKAALIGPKAYYLDPTDDGRPRVLFAGAYHKRLPLRFTLPGAGEPDDGAVECARRVDVMWGHGMLVRLEALDRIGLFDQGFFLYHEDVDLCLRLRYAGYEIWYEPTAVMWHDLSDSDRAEKSQMWRWQHKVDSAWHFHRKHYRWPMAALLGVLTTVHEAAHLARQGHAGATIHLMRAQLRWLLKVAGFQG